MSLGDDDLVVPFCRQCIQQTFCCVDCGQNWYPSHDEQALCDECQKEYDESEHGEEDREFIEDERWLEDDPSGMYFEYGTARCLTCRHVHKATETCAVCSSVPVRESSPGGGVVKVEGVASNVGDRVITESGDLVSGNLGTRGRFFGGLGGGRRGTWLACCVVLLVVRKGRIVLRFQIKLVRPRLQRIATQDIALAILMRLYNNYM